MNIQGKLFEFKMNNRFLLIAFVSNTLNYKKEKIQKSLVVALSRIKFSYKHTPRFNGLKMCYTFIKATAIITCQISGIQRVETKTF